MALFDKLFGKKTTETRQADSDLDKKPRGLLVVFDEPNSFSPDSLQKTLRKMGPTLQGLELQCLEGTVEQQTPLIRLTWDKHVVDVIGFPGPLPKPSTENCVQPAHYAKEIKARIRAHRAHVVLFYSGNEPDPLEQYVALGVVAAAFSKHGASGILNESAMTSLPANTVFELATSKPNFDLLRHTPLPFFFCGFVKYFLPDGKTSWMRTYNNPAFGLPDLAAVGRIDQGQSTFETFTALMTYLLDSGKRFAPGHTAQFGDKNLKFRAPRDDEPFPTHTDGQLLIVETIH